MRNLLALIAGGLFGLGLHLSGMTNTQKVIGWLDIFGNWDPTLAFVMGGAMIPMAIAWYLTQKTTPLVGGSFPARPEQKISKDLVIGSIMFGMGWGLAGLCPGPAIASLSYGGQSGLIFLAAMLAGMAIAPSIKRKI